MILDAAKEAPNLENFCLQVSQNNKIHLVKYLLHKLNWDTVLKVTYNKISHYLCFEFYVQI